jgi:hypothetical protein
MQSQNGWPVPPRESDLRKWQIPGSKRYFTLLNSGEGFSLCHLILWYHETIEPIDVGTWDDWAFDPNARNIRGATSGLSNHDSALAVDLNATKHPQGVRGSYSTPEVNAIHHRLYWYNRLALGSPVKKMPRTWNSNANDAVIRWGEDYQHSPCDGMHFEWNRAPRSITGPYLARRLSRTPRGRAIMQENKGAHIYHG